MATHPGLVRVELDGEAAYDVPDAAYDATPAEGVRLFSGRAAERALVPSGQAGNYPVLLVDGQVGGVWHQKRSGRLAVTVEPLRRLAKERVAALEDQVARLGEVLEGEATLTIGEVSVGPHA